MIDVQAEFEALDDEFLEFEKIENPLHPRPDICAFLKLHELCPRDLDMVSAAEHDQIFLDVSPEELGKVATHEDIVFLNRCGVRYCNETDSLAMFV